jgi:Zn-finger nucleic acid-binding protein
MDRDEFATCPRCGAALDATPDRLTCKPCGGIFLTEPAISKLIADMLGTAVSHLGWSARVAEPQPLKLVEREATEAAPTCPRCTTAMAPKSLYGIAVDRCEAHGIWFDKSELEATLQKAAKVDRFKSGWGEKVFGGVMIAAYIAGTVLQLILG